MRFTTKEKKDAPKKAKVEKQSVKKAAPKKSESKNKK